MARQTDSVIRTTWDNWNHLGGGTQFSLLLLSKPLFNMYKSTLVSSASFTLFPGEETARSLQRGRMTSADGDHWPHWMSHLLHKQIILKTNCSNVFLSQFNQISEFSSHIYENVHNPSLIWNLICSNRLFIPLSSFYYCEVFDRSANAHCWSDSGLSQTPVETVHVVQQDMLQSCCDTEADFVAQIETGLTPVWRTLCR